MPDEREQRGIDPTVSRLLSANEQTLAALRETIHDAMVLATRTHDAVFGKWDDARNEQLPGIRDQIAAMESWRRSHDLRDNWVIRIAAAVGGILLLDALGVPTSAVGRLLYDLFHSLGSVH